MKKYTVAVFLLILLLNACSATPTWQEQYDLGVRYLSEGNYEEAIIAFTEAIEIDPKQVPAYVGRGDAYIGSGETEENLAAALTDYEKAVELDKTCAEGYLGIADVYIRQGEYEKAYEILELGLEKTDGNEKIADKIAKIESGVYADSSQHIRRQNNYTVAGELDGYTEYHYDFLGRQSKWENYYLSYEEEGNFGEFALESTCEVDFDEENRPSAYRFYNADGSEAKHDTFVYNEQGLIARQNRYTNEGELDCYFLFYYNGQGQEIRCENYRPDGTMKVYWVSEYDEEGNLIRETRYNSGGMKVGYSTFD